jgi:hypothetical protein
MLRPIIDIPTGSKATLPRLSESKYSAQRRIRTGLIADDFLSLWIQSLVSTISYCKSGVYTISQMKIS